MTGHETGAGNFSFCHRIDAWGLKRPGHEADHSRLVPRLRVRRSIYLYLSLSVHGVLSTGRTLGLTCILDEGNLNFEKYG
jgi:hypothetical protein